MNNESTGRADLRVLGSAGPAQINTGGHWKERAKQAYRTRQEGEHARQRELILALVNMLDEVLGEDIDSTKIHVPSVDLDGEHFTIHEYRASRDPGRPPEYRLAVGIKCWFCERLTEREFGTREELGEILEVRPGNCIHCNKPLSARATSAS